jgi:outer membrane receptor for ferrienterochelin and colicin
MPCWNGIVGFQPSVGIYLDEEPSTTIQGPLDLHMYDIQRVEALAGPQGTLYGASSQSGTIRYITNKPAPGAFSASISAEVNAIDHGGEGFVTEGYVNLPLTEWMALRVVRLVQAGCRLYRQRPQHTDLSVRASRSTTPLSCARTSISPTRAAVAWR